jgi:L-threonylcarbamoyladenylate synthase
VAQPVSGGVARRAPIAPDAPGARRLRECLCAGGVAVIPTDTVYGLACDPLQSRAVQRLYELKGRPPTRPAAVMFFALAPALGALPELGPRARAALEELLPGPLTVLLPNPAGRFPLACRVSAGCAPSGDTAADGPVGDSAHGPALGLRVPLLPEPLAALRVLERPVMQSSANVSGEPDARRLDGVPRALREGVDLVLDGGELPGIASTVLDLRAYEHAGEWSIARAGPVGRAELERVLGPSAPRQNCGGE